MLKPGRSGSRAPRRPTSSSPEPSGSRSRGRAKKVSLTVDEVVLHALQKDAKRSGRTLSAEVTEALARELRRRRLQELIGEYEAEHGFITAEELASVQAEWRD
jgi:hypothetical protein